jgi:hypothetical protein
MVDAIFNVKERFAVVKGLAIKALMMRASRMEVSKSAELSKGVKAKCYTVHGIFVGKCLGIKEFRSLAVGRCVLAHSVGCYKLPAWHKRARAFDRGLHGYRGFNAKTQMAQSRSSWNSVNS